MKLELEVRGQTLYAVSADELSSLGPLACVVDLRKAQERTGGPALEEGSTSPRLVRVPVTSDSLSEQDMDQIRREFVRGGEVAVVSTRGKRAAAVVLMHAGRTLAWSVEETLARASEVALSGPLEKFLREYLERHRDKNPPAAPRSQTAGP